MCTYHSSEENKTTIVKHSLKKRRFMTS